MINISAKRKIKEKDGFTLIELLMVITICVVLIAIFIPNMAKYINSSRIESYRISASEIYRAAVHAIAMDPSMATDDIEETERNIKQYMYDHNSIDGDYMDIINDPKIKIHYEASNLILWVEYHGIRYPVQAVDDSEEESIDD